MTHLFDRKHFEHHCKGSLTMGAGHSLLAYSSTLRGIAKLQLDEAALAADLDTSWEVRANGCLKLHARRTAIVEQLALR